MKAIIRCENKQDPKKEMYIRVNQLHEKDGIKILSLQFSLLG